ncbi:DEAD/DEAH box helicase [Rhodoferax antarcticus]|uniref:ATP-dependent RNA helicase RhlE n=1 Tax=Rhodoferax antarcticus ANT.BR TaxID=1111071 RepID=A0A1Q8YDG5_9BURK|nr:DEAD/DEAH box helicase [Rhodoferax antarcticus]APW45964.1 RNA helicase [Rhodoferax antarcticus]MCW2310489.1 ATP-dependent RNA helicase RhlE [Rhodoferax antarcticus]OLP06088.1 DEAD/DEAH box helicase domain protein [Rhodoferax antarcticus ANT.BR]
MKFEELNLAPAIIKAVLEQGYETPTPIQAQAIPLVLDGHDLLGGAQTGTGKTAAFVLPMLNKLSSAEAPRNKFGGIALRALVLTPTRELAAQVEESVQTYGKYLDITSAAVFGGVGMNPQISRMKKGVDILVATPGRLLDLMQQGMVDLSQVQILVLDEADRMLDMGFIHDVKKVLAAVPKDKQSLLFSATFSDEIRDLAATLLKNPQSVQVTPRNTTVQRIAQLIHPVGRGKKKALLAHIVQEHNWSQVLVFTRTKFGANNVAEFLTKNGINAMALHGNKSQTARTQALADFKSGDVRALVATDIAARGIDIDDLPHVVNYDIPNVCEDYVHRIGRTGRAGAEGQAVSLVSLDEEGFMQAIERFTKQDIPVEIKEGFMPEPGEKAEPIAMGRQTIWGGAGKPPSREVMMAAGKAARSEMLTRVRESKGPGAARPGNGAGNGGGAGRGRSSTGGGGGARGPRPAGGERRPAGLRTEGSIELELGGGREAEPRSHLSAAEQAARGPGQRQARGYGGGNGGGYGGPAPAPSRSAGGQPDPMRTSVDMMADRGARRSGGFSGGGNRSAGAPSGSFGGGSGPSRSGSGNRSGSRGRSGGPSGGPRGPSSR